MNIIQSEEMQDTLEMQENVIDQTRIEEARVKFDTLRESLLDKRYSINLNQSQTDYLFNEFYQAVSWKGYESYAISETFDRLCELVSYENDEATLTSGELEAEIIEAVFHFLKNYISNGIESARLFRQICDQFALPMKEINEDRQALRDLSFELLAAEQGVSVETLIKNSKSSQ